MLETFKGDLSWVHAREGHAGSPYWPGGASGVTLDPGIDLGYIDAEIVRKNYGELMTATQLREAFSVLGVKGEPARLLLPQRPSLSRFKISPEQAGVIFPVVAGKYWQEIIRRWPELKTAPPCVQTAMLSLGYNRGPDNRRLSILSISIVSRKWENLGNKIYKMQQNHKLPGIRKRRRLEGALILKNWKRESPRGIIGLKRMIPAPIRNLFR